MSFFSTRNSRLHRRRLFPAMGHTAYALAVVLLVLAGVALSGTVRASGLDGTVPQQIASSDQPRLLANPVRERRWVLMRAWLRGASIEREPTMNPAFSEPALAELGSRLFAMYCVNCHGSEGRGNGPRAAVFAPAGPRDLTRGLFKFRSTPSGRPPTKTDLFRTISGGLRGTGMVPFADLSELQRWALVAYVRRLSGNQTEEAEEAAMEIEVPERPAKLDTALRAGRGKEVYERLGCAQCHGPQGRGDGPAAARLRDFLDRPAQPPDFAVQPFKRGGAAQDLYRTIVTGLDGTPMPSYQGAVAGDELWDLIAFVRALKREAAGRVDPRELAQARAHVSSLEQQGLHAVAGGCGCQAGKAL